MASDTELSLMLAVDGLKIEDFCLLSNTGQIDRRERSRFTMETLQQMSDDECNSMFRFSREDICKLMDGFRIPERYVCEQRTVASGLEALLILLRRLAYPNRLCDLAKEFNRLESELSLIFNIILDDIYSRFAHKLTDLNQPWVDVPRFSAATTGKGYPLLNCWGFIDGACMAICRPTIGQKCCYSGHKRQHCLKFQSVMTPCDLIAHFYGPIEGSRHDAYMLGQSGLLDELENGQFKDYCVYGDPVYPLRLQLLAPYRAENNEQQIAFNKAMSKVRQCVWKDHHHLCIPGFQEKSETAFATRI